MIKLTIAQIIPMFTNSKNLLSLSLPAKESYRLGLAMRQVEEKYQIYDQTRQKFILQYGEKIESENVIRVKPENVPSFNKEMEGLLSETFEIDMDPIPVSLFTGGNVTVEMMMIFSPFFVE